MVFILKDNGSNEREIAVLTPILAQTRQVHLYSKFSKRNPKSKFNPQLVKNAGKGKYINFCKKN